MEKLIQDLETATEGSREWDAEVWAAVATNADLDCPDFAKGWEPRFRASEDGKVTLYAKNMKTEEWLERSRRPAPDYTTSLDAALTLVPDGLHVLLHTGQWTRYMGASVQIFATDEEGAEWTRANTPALALCVAALKARQIVLKQTA